MIDLKRRAIEYSKNVYGNFYEFLKINPSGACVVLHQLGVVSIGPSGTFEWSVDTGLITDFVRVGDEDLICVIMDESPIRMDLRTGFSRRSLSPTK